MNVNDFNERINRLHKKLGSHDRSSRPVASATFEHELLNTRQEIALESVQILRSRYRREKEYWQTLFEKKDHEIKNLQEKLSRFENELAEVRAQLEEERLKEIKRIKSDVDGFQAKQEEIVRHETAFRKELEFYQHTSADAQERLKTEKESFITLRGRWSVKEKEWEALIMDREEETAGIRQEYAEKELELFQKQKSIEEEKEILLGEVNRLRSGLESERRHGKTFTEESLAKNHALQSSLEKTYQQLEMEQKLKEINVNEFKLYKAQIEELKLGRARMLEEWDKERAQWRDLWDKERLIWEKRKNEVIEWEKRLRQERERWILSGVPEPEKLLKEFMRPTPPVPSAPLETRPAEKRPPKKPYLRPLLAATWNAVLLRRRTRARRIIFTGLIGIPVLVSTCFLYRSTSIYPLSRITPNAFGISSQYLVVYDKAKASMSFFVPGKMVLPKKVITFKKSMSIDSFVFAGGLMWSCDAANDRIYLHRENNPLQIEGSFPSPGPEPSLVAWDGKDLWSFDAHKGELYLHVKDFKLSVKETFQLGSVQPAAMSWWKGYLWIYDLLTHEVLKYKRVEKNLVKTNSYFLSKKLSFAPVLDVSGIGFRRGGLWLSGRKEKKLVRYNFSRVKLYNLPF